MIIEKLNFSHIRNLEETTLLPSPSLNFIVGSNGSGKSSLIEAISLITSARSFRTKKISRTVNSSHTSSTVFSKFVSGLTHYRVGFHRDNKKNISVIRINGEPVYKASTLVSTFPQLIISPEQCNLIDGSPERRRSFIDWSLFHVKHDYNYLLSNYKKTLSQRNSLLRRGEISQIDHWDSVMCEYAEKIDTYRCKLFEEILTILKDDIARKFSTTFNFDTLSISYCSGWKRGESLQSILRESRDIDIDRGFTHNGVHRADFKITVSGVPAREVLSRGEKKLIQILFSFAQLIHFRQKLNIVPILLMDDIFAELDQENTDLLFDMSRELGLQLFVTATDLIDIHRYMKSDEKLFHVKHGSITEMKE